MVGIITGSVLERYYFLWLIVVALQHEKWNRTCTESIIVEYLVIIRSLNKSVHFSACKQKI